MSDPYKNIAVLDSEPNLFLDLLALLLYEACGLFHASLECWLSDSVKILSRVGKLSHLGLDLISSFVEDSGLLSPVVCLNLREEVDVVAIDLGLQVDLDLMEVADEGDAPLTLRPPGGWPFGESQDAILLLGGDVLGIFH